MGGENVARRISNKGHLWRSVTRATNQQGFFWLPTRTKVNGKDDLSIATILAGERRAAFTILPACLIPKSQDEFGGEISEKKGSDSLATRPEEPSTAQVPKG